MPVTFAAGLGNHLRSKKKLSFWERRLQKVIDAKPSKRRTELLAKLEAAARLKMGVAATAKIDWGSIDWAQILDFIMKLIVLLAPLFI